MFFLPIFYLSLFIMVYWLLQLFLLCFCCFLHYESNICIRAMYDTCVPRHPWKFIIYQSLFSLKGHDHNFSCACFFCFPHWGRPNDYWNCSSEQRSNNLHEENILFTVKRMPTINMKKKIACSPTFFVWSKYNLKEVVTLGRDHKSGEVMKQENRCHSNSLQSWWKNCALILLFIF